MTDTIHTCDGEWTEWKRSRFPYRSEPGIVQWERECLCCGTLDARWLGATQDPNVPPPPIACLRFP